MIEKVWISSDASFEADQQGCAKQINKNLIYIVTLKVNQGIKMIPVKQTLSVRKRSGINITTKFNFIYIHSAIRFQFL